MSIIIPSLILDQNLPVGSYKKEKPILFKDHLYQLVQGNSYIKFKERFLAGILAISATIATLGLAIFSKTIANYYKDFFWGTRQAVYLTSSSPIPEQLKNATENSKTAFALTVLGHGCYLKKSLSQHSSDTAQQALLYFDQALKIDPKCTSALMSRAKVYLDLASSNLNAVIEIDPKNDSALKMRDNIRQDKDKDQPYLKSIDSKTNSKTSVLVQDSLISIDTNESSSQPIIAKSSPTNNNTTNNIDRGSNNSVPESVIESHANDSSDCEEYDDNDSNSLDSSEEPFIDNSQNRFTHELDDSNGPETEHLIKGLKLRQKNPDQAKEEFSSVLEHGDDYFALFNRAKLYQVEKKFDLALVDLNKALGSYSKHYLDTILLARAEVYKEKGDLDLALQDIQKVLELDSEDEEALSLKKEIEDLIVNSKKNSD